VQGKDTRRRSLPEGSGNGSGNDSGKGSDWSGGETAGNGAGRSSRAEETGITPAQRAGSSREQAEFE
jgi:hypothetical protein